MAKPEELEIDPTKTDPDELAEAIKKLSPEEALFFLAKLEAVMNKRKLQLTGYLVAFVTWLVATFFALWYFGTHDGFVGWVFLVPFALVGATLWLFGKWAERVGNRAPPPDLVAAAKGKQK